MPNELLTAMIESAPWAQPWPSGIDTDDNAMRADRAGLAVLAYSKSCYFDGEAEDIETAISDLFNDACHLARRFGLDAGEIFARAHRMYEVECIESRADPLVPLA